MKASLLEDGEQGVGLISTGVFDPEIYEGSDSRFAGYVTSIAANEQEEASIWFFVFFFLFQIKQSSFFQECCFVSHRLSFVSFVRSLTAPLCLLWGFEENLASLAKFEWTHLFSFLPQDDEDDTSTSLLGQKKPGYHAPVAILNAIPQSDEQVCSFTVWAKFQLKRDLIF